MEQACIMAFGLSELDGEALLEVVDPNYYYKPALHGDRCEAIRVDSASVPPVCSGQITPGMCLERMGTPLRPTFVTTFGPCSRAATGAARTKAL